MDTAQAFILRVLVLDQDPARRDLWRAAVAGAGDAVHVGWAPDVAECQIPLWKALQGGEPYHVLVLDATTRRPDTGLQGVDLAADVAERFPDLHVMLSAEPEALPQDVPVGLASRLTLLRSPLCELELRQALRVTRQLMAGRGTPREPSTAWSAMHLATDDRERDAQDAAIFRSLLSSLQDFIYVKDSASRLIRCGRMMTEWVAKGDPTQLIGRTDREIYGEEHYRKTRELELRVMQTGQADNELNEDQPGRIGLRIPLMDPAGQALGILGIAFRVPGVNRLVDRLRADQHLLKTLLEATSDRIYFKDLHSRITLASRAMAEMHGVADPAALLGKTDADLFLPEHADQALADERRIIATGEPILNIVEKETMPDGSICWCLTSKSPLHDAHGQIVGTFGISKDITALKEAERELAETHHQLLETSRRAGMAEVATGVLHNVGNVLNSVNVSVAMIGDRLRKSRVSHVPRLAKLLEEHAGDLAAFIAQDPQGQQLPTYVARLADALTQEHDRHVAELESLRRNVEHIKDIVAMQQSYAQVAGVSERVAMVDLLDDALAINAAGLSRHGVELRREVCAAPVVFVEKHKVLQILVNLISNAKYACDASARPDRKVTVRLDQTAPDRVRVTVSDNGVGIAPEHMERLFTHGFTTKKGGHGFGLHNSALAARELRGAIHAHSDGPGRGARFTFEMPVDTATPSAAA